MKHLLLKNAIRTAVLAMSMLSGTAMAAISSKPVTKDATEGAKKLYSFLVDNFGKNTISGVQTGDLDGTSNLATNADVKTVYEKSGKYPALVGLDLLFTTGKGCGESWYQSYTNTTKLLARELWSKGGIPAYTWHWKDPSYETSSHGSKSVKDPSNFDYTVAFKEGTTEWDTTNTTYKEMVADIDSISTHFLDLQKDGVACIWRPLHEASGGWFWWGTGTGEQYKAFYKLMYDRMVNVNGVKNCVWVWNIERTGGYDQNYLDESWYPGDEYVDVIAVDVYKNANDNGSLSEYYKKIVEKMGSDKIIALSENGPIPDVDKMHKDGAVWSWWMPWYESWSGGYVSQTSDDLWKSNMASDKIITLDEMSDWGTYTGPIIVSDPCELNTDIRMEAECADYSGEVVGDESLSASKGVKVGENDGYINFKFNVKEAGTYKVIVRGAPLYGVKQAAIKVGNNSINIEIADDSEIEVGTFRFAKGENIVSAVPGWTWWVLDYARIEADNEASKPITPAEAPINDKATESAKKLYSFLYNNFGKKTISGFMLGDMSTGSNGLDNHEDFKVVYEKSGKYPALVGVDMMNATGIKTDQGDSYFIDYTKKSVKLAKEIWTRGGIPAITWHWRDPSRSCGEFYVLSSDHPDGTVIDFASLAIKNGEWDKSSEFYKNMIKDIDVIADYMLELQDAGAAAIFRPLHEASGGWFWWGTCSGADYAMLYRLIYDEMVNVKGVNNLIWVWNPQSTSDSDWNPGEEYFDVISVDIYNKAYDNSSNYVAFNSLKALSDNKKIIALSENGPVPDPEECYENDATWSWWMPWYQSWGNNFADQTSNDNWKTYMASEQIITLDEMPGWDKYEASLDKQLAENNDIIVYPTNIKDQIVVASKKDFKVEIVNMNGTLLENDFCAAGTKTISANGWANGIYMISVSTADGDSKNVKVIK